MNVSTRTTISQAISILEEIRPARNRPEAHPPLLPPLLKRKKKRKKEISSNLASFSRHYRFLLISSTEFPFRRPSKIQFSRLSHLVESPTANFRRIPPRPSTISSLPSKSNAFTRVHAEFPLSLRKSYLTQPHVEIVIDRECGNEQAGCLTMIRAKIHSDNAGVHLNVSAWKMGICVGYSIPDFSFSPSLVYFFLFSKITTIYIAV